MILQSKYRWKSSRSIQ